MRIRVLKQLPGDTLPSVFRDNSQVLDRPRSTIVAAQNCAYDFAAFRGSDSAEAWVSLKKGLNRLWRIRLVQSDALNPGPKLDRLLVVLKHKSSV